MTIRGVVLVALGVLCLTNAEALAETELVEVRLPHVTFVEGEDWISVNISGGKWRVTPRSGFPPGLQARVFSGAKKAVRHVGESPDRTCWVYETTVIAHKRLPTGELELHIPPSWMGLTKENQIEDRTYTVVFEESKLPSGEWYLLKEHKEHYFSRAKTFVVVPDPEVESRWKDLAAEQIKRGRQAYRSTTRPASGESRALSCVVVADISSDTIRVALAASCSGNIDSATYSELREGLPFSPG